MSLEDRTWFLFYLKCTMDSHMTASVSEVNVMCTLAHRHLLLLMCVCARALIERIAIEGYFA